MTGKSGGAEIIARLPKAAKVSPGDRLPVRWQLDNAVIFAHGTGERV